MLTGLDGDLNHYEISYILPYVLNPLILLKLIHKLTGGVEINNNNINSKLQYILKKCNFIKDIILSVSAQLFLSDPDTSPLKAV